MRLLAYTPIHVDFAEFRRRQERYDALSPVGVSVVLRNIGPDAPRALDTEADVRASEVALAAAFRASDPDEFDGYLPDCVLDPCAEEADSFERPLYGLTRLTASFYASQGHRLGALARNAAIAAELDRRVAGYGIPAEPTVVMDLSFDDIADSRAWADAVTVHARALTCSVAINACSAVDLTGPRTTPLVVDPTATALRLLALRDDLEPAS
ncbi:MULTISPECIES: hydantoin racemase [unclassified Rhodococcus (in: high G+C Gram-positive bacteria)]|uniref:hydantoin racemase n=1 Tax=unclassified Rhodococcus (in: high G+C Gram-positive bacteria) TaxID=192944 RepID=UPI00254F4BBB|nr:MULTISPECIES: hydantoin racemase [unclassified Rhodococcus (in: high G+C Gram-positive bacteria)]MDQ1200414.1 Asp/Glu/hydantoin racemase [Rhodococcus sp. SORGH_AS_0303]